MACARECGATVLRGVEHVVVSGGSAPNVKYTFEGESQTTECRLIVGADGRSSSVRRQIGLKLTEDPIDHLIAGLLVEGADDWPEDLQSLGRDGDIMYAIFPQGGGKIRLYADYDLSERNRFGGEKGAQKFLEVFNMPCVPHSELIVKARPIGICRSNPSLDAWIDNPWVDGVVLMGDAAGYNDPIIGQDLSITFRDARMLAEILVADPDWSPAVLQPYGTERSERLRRLRLAGHFATTINARFGPEVDRIRGRAMGRMAADPSIGGIVDAVFIGPENVDARYFEPDFMQATFG